VTEGIIASKLIPREFINLLTINFPTTNSPTIAIIETAIKFWPKIFKSYEG
jgi:hypothetical protein